MLAELLLTNIFTTPVKWLFEEFSESFLGKKIYKSSSAYTARVTEIIVQMFCMGKNPM
jgi:hypothetical protein